jgi:hypothetical protein
MINSLCRKSSRQWGSGLAFTILIVWLLWPGVAICGTTSFSGFVEGITGIGPCATSAHDASCPTPNALCSCLGGNGKVSGSVGNGYGSVSLDENFNLSSSGCAQLNGSMFAVGNRDVEQVDFSGSFCPAGGDHHAIFAGTYEVVRSAEGRTESGKVTGTRSLNSPTVLHFIEEK